MDGEVLLEWEDETYSIGRACKWKDSQKLLDIIERETPLWIIHDSIMTIESRSEFVKKVMEEEFAKLGVHPRLRVEGFAREPEESAARISQRVLVVLSEVGTDLMSDDPTTHRLHSHEHGSYGTAV